MNKAVEVFKAEDFFMAIWVDELGRLDQQARELMARRANQLLAERAVRVYGGHANASCWSQGEQLQDSHQALLISIQPIAKEDSAEGLLRELCQWASESNIIEYTGRKPPDTLSMHSIVGRARKLLDKQAAKG